MWLASIFLNRPAMALLRWFQRRRSEKGDRASR
jgi:hypothetical protein